MFKPQEIFPVIEKTLQKALIALLALVAFFLPFKFLVNLFIALSLVTWLLSNPFKSIFIRTPNTPTLLTILVFYLLHAIALIYTNNISEGLFSLEIKISLLIFPLIFYTKQFTLEQYLFFIKSFILGTLSCCMLCLSRATILFLYKHENNFSYESLAWFQHPSYLAMYITFCCIALLSENIFSKKATYPIILFFTFFVLLLSSKTGIVMHFTMLIFYIASLFLKGKNYLKIASAAVLGLTFFCTCLYIIPSVKQRFEGALVSFQSNNTDKSTTESTAVRKLIWNEAIQISKQNLLLGVSPGDANDALYQNYKQNGLTGAYEKKLNAHSQYFQTLLGLGLIGLLSLLSIFIIPLVGNRKKIVLFFLVITAFNFLTESMLQTMAGCIFLGYFYGIICFKRNAIKVPNT